MNNDSQTLPDFIQVCAANHFLAKYLDLANPAPVVDLLDDGGRLPSSVELQRSLVQELAGADQTSEATVVLRRYYARSMMRIAYRELIGELPPEQVGRNLAAAADVLVDVTLQYVMDRLVATRGMPERADGSIPQVTVIGLGNYGGRELGYGSSLRLVFLYDSIDHRNIWHRDFYQTVVSEFVKLLQGDASRTDGIDVDLRDGPRQEVGVPICGFREALRIYETSGRVWQRLNFVKARVVAGSQSIGDQFIDRLQPWIYRQFLSRVDLAELKILRNKIEHQRDRIAQDSASVLSSSTPDLAGQPGGREHIELAIQFLQLLHGASLPSVRSGNTFEAITALQQADCLTHQEGSLLLANYARLCHLQNQISIMFDRSGRHLPKEPASLSKLAWHLGIRTGDSSDTKDSSGDVARFEELLADTFAKNCRVIDHLMLDAPTDGNAVAAETELLLDPDPDANQVREVLSKHRLVDAQRAMDNLQALSTETVPFLSPHRCRHFFSSIAPALLAEISRTPDPDQVLSTLEIVTGSLGAKATLWELLASSQPTMRLMIRLCASAPYLTEILTNNPGMIDELIDSLLMNRLPSPQRLDAHSIELCRGAVDVDKILHSFKSGAHLMIGVRDILQKEPLEATHQALADTAEACVRRVIEYEQEQLSERFGDPVDAEGYPAELMALALGKFGGREPNYRSDLDTVFLYSAEGETKRRIGGHYSTLTNQRFFNQLAKQSIDRINGVTSERRLYELDSRMSPTDAEGEFAVSIDLFFGRFESDSVPIWQRMAICRARPVSGSRTLRRQIEARIQKVIRDTAWQPEWLEEIRDIRSRMEATAGVENFKRGVGGTIDVEFIAQMLMLRYAGQSPEVAQLGTTATLRALTDTGHLDETMSLNLIRSYRTLRRIEAGLQLLNTHPRHELPIGDNALMRNLAYLMNESDPSMMIASCQQARQEIRSILDQVFDSLTR